MQSPSPLLISEFIRAGAGAGKTTALVEKVLSVAKSIQSSTQKSPKIVVTTFTRKATQELRERMLQKAILDSPEWTEFVCNSNLLNITTIHGLFNQFLRCYGIYIGLDSSFQVISDFQNKILAKKILRKCLHQNNQYSELLDQVSVGDLTDLLIWHFNQSTIFPHLKSASKEDLVLHLQSHINQMVQFGSLLVSSVEDTTSDAKWSEYSANIKLSLTYLPENLEGCAAQLGILSKPRANKKNPTIEEELDKEVSEYVKLLKGQIELWQNEKLLLGPYEEFYQLFGELSKVWSEEYFKQKMESASITQSDIEVLSYKVLSTDSSTGELFGQDWNYWFFDEYQDTSPLQEKILKSFVQKNPTYTVGDPQQSIYLFRGSRAEVFFNRQNEIKASAGEVVEKLKNHRSEPELLEFFNYIFCQMGDQFKPMTPFFKNSPDLNPQKIVAEIFDCSKDKEELTEDSKADSEENSQAQACVQTCIRLTQEGAALQDLAILVRTNLQLRTIEKLAKAAKLPIQVHRGKKLSEFLEVSDALALLKFLVNPHDNINLMKLLRSPWLRIPDSQLVQITQVSYRSLWSELQKVKDTSEVVQYLLQLAKDSQEKGVVEVWENAILNLGIIDMSYQYDETGVCESNLWKLINMVRAKERTPNFNVIDILEEILNEESDLEGSTEAPALFEPHRVNLMTVHASKGLQFSHVLIPFWDSSVKQMPSGLALVDEETQMWTGKIYDPESDKKVLLSLGRNLEKQRHKNEMKEFERLYYVALTRAKEKVYLYFAKNNKNSWLSSTHLNLEYGTHNYEKFSYISQKWQSSQLSYQSYENQQTQLIEPLNLVSKDYKVMSPSSLLDSSLQKKSVESDSIINMYEKVKHGIDLHKAFELLKYHSPEVVLNIINCKEEFHFALNQKEVPILEIIQNGYVEWGFSTKVNETVLQGQVDLWGEDNQGQLWLIDYKSGSSLYTEKAMDQLALYTLALKACKKIETHKQVNWCVLYVKENKVKLQKNILIDKIVQEQSLLFG